MERYCNNENLSPEKADGVLAAGLKKFGFDFPTTAEEVEQFEKVFGTTNIDLPDNLKTPDFIFRSSESDDIRVDVDSQSHNLVGASNVKDFILKNKVMSMDKTVNSNPTHITTIPIKHNGGAAFYRRMVLAAEIVHQLHNEIAFGHVKLQKLIFLSQRVQKIDLPIAFLKQAMGPYDPKAMRSIDKQLKLKKWFEFRPNELLKYKALSNAGEHKADFDRYFSNSAEKIYWLIETFRKSKSSKIEIVATLFACWEELIAENRITITDKELFEKFYSWSQFKQNYKQGEVEAELYWMKSINLVPCSL